MTPKASDTEWYEHALEGVDTHETNYTLKFDGGLCLGCPKVDGLPDPQVGETIRCYGRGFGYAVRGIVVGGRVYRYQTVAEEQAQWERERQENERKAEEKLAATVEETDKRIALLPTLLRERILKFQESGGHSFRRDLEQYELFCCEQAALIAHALKTAEAIVKFHAAGWKEQLTLVPGLSDGHSGNTFGMACLLAKLLVAQSDDVTKVPGALSPIVGSDAYHHA